MKEIKKTTTKNGVPINSKYVLKINFNSNTYDHD